MYWTKINLAFALCIPLPKVTEHTARQPNNKFEWCKVYGKHHLAKPNLRQLSQGIFVCLSKSNIVDILWISGESKNDYSLCYPPLPLEFELCSNVTRPISLWDMISVRVFAGIYHCLLMLYIKLNDPEWSWEFWETCQLCPLGCDEWQVIMTGVISNGI